MARAQHYDTDKSPSGGRWKHDLAAELMPISHTVGNLMRNGEFTNTPKQVFWEDRRALPQRIKYLTALEEMLNTNYYHLWEAGKKTKKQFTGVVRNVINQIKKEPSRSTSSLSMMRTTTRPTHTKPEKTSKSSRLARQIS
jgi:hypothetical protein